MLVPFPPPRLPTPACVSCRCATHVSPWASGHLRRLCRHFRARIAGPMPRIDWAWSRPATMSWRWCFCSISPQRAPIWRPPAPRRARPHALRCLPLANPTSSSGNKQRQVSPSFVAKSASLEASCALCTACARCLTGSMIHIASCFTRDMAFWGQTPRTRPPVASSRVQLPMCVDGVEDLQVLDLVGQPARRCPR